MTKCSVFIDGLFCLACTVTVATFIAGSIVYLPKTSLIPIRGTVVGFAGDAGSCKGNTIALVIEYTPFDEEYYNMTGCYDENSFDIGQDCNVSVGDMHLEVPASFSCVTSVSYDPNDPSSAWTTESLIIGKLMFIGSALMLGALCLIYAFYKFVPIASERVVQYGHANKTRHDDEDDDSIFNV